MRFLLTCLLCLASAEASADRITDKPTVRPRFKLATAIEANLNQYSNEAAVRLSELTLGVFDMRFDLKSRRARLNFGGGDPETFRLHIDSDVLIGKGRARLQARLDLAIAGHQWVIEVPELDLDTENVLGQRAVMLSLPLVEGSF